MDGIEQYLNGDQAPRDVGMLLGGRGTVGGLRIGKEQAWQYVESTIVTGLCAYFRVSGNRFIVTDNGDGVRALRLRTGITEISQTPDRGNHTLRERVAREVARSGVVHGQHLVGLWPDNRIETTVLSGYLTSVMCRVMLAVYRVGRLEL